LHVLSPNNKFKIQLFFPVHSYLLAGSLIPAFLLFLLPLLAIFVVLCSFWPFLFVPVADLQRFHAWHSRVGRGSCRRGE